MAKMRRQNKLKAGRDGVKVARIWLNDENETSFEASSGELGVKVARKCLNGENETTKQAKSRK